MAKLVEVDEAEYQRLRTLSSVAARIASNKEAIQYLERAHKIVEPNAPTPHLDAQRQLTEPVEKAKSELAAEIAALRKEREDEKRETTLARIASDQEKAFARLKTGPSRYTDEGIAAIRKLMETKGLLDVDDAVAIFERTNPPQIATPGGGMTGDRWNFADPSDAEQDKNIAVLLANKGDGGAADAAAMRMANQALAEIRGMAR